jgi:predicted transcriptional regulator
VKRSKIRKNGIGRIPWYAKGAAQHLGLHICPKKHVRLGTGGLTMAKAVLISIRPEWVEKIARGEKTVEVRKTRPKLDTPFKCYIYCTQGNDARRLRGSWGKVIGEFICDRVETIKAATEPYGIYDVDDYFVAQTRLVDGALWDYGKGATLYGWHISKLEIYDTPKKLSKFLRPFENCIGKVCDEYGCAYCENGHIKRPPQSWCYVEEQ